MKKITEWTQAEKTDCYTYIMSLVDGMYVVKDMFIQGSYAMGNMHEGSDLDVMMYVENFESYNPIVWFKTSPPYDAHYNGMKLDLKIRSDGDIGRADQYLSRSGRIYLLSAYSLVTNTWMPGNKTDIADFNKLRGKI